MSKFYTLTPQKNQLQRAFFAMLILTACLANYSVSFAQYKVVKSESFDGAQYFPFGWTGGKISGTDVNNFTERVIAGTNPACATHTGAGMMRYRSGFMFNAGEQYFVASPRYDLTNNVGAATISFWMYKDNTFTANKDSVTLYLNDSASVTTYPGMCGLKVIGPISRDTTAGGVGWKQYTAVIPASINTSKVYAVFVFTNRQTAASANIYIDDFSIDTYPKPMTFTSSTLFFQETSDVNKGANDQLIIGIKVIVDGAGDSLRVDSVITNINGTSSAADLVALSTKIWWTKGTNSFVMIPGTNQYGTGLTGAYTGNFFTQAGFYLENGENYFWGTLSTTAGATSGNCIDLDFMGITAFDNAVKVSGQIVSPPLVSSLFGCRQIDVSLCNGVIPTLTVGTSWLSGSYTNNDYIARVYMRAANTVTPAYSYIDNDKNTFAPAVAPYFSAIGVYPFTLQPPSYEQMPATDNVVAWHPHVTAVLVQGANYVAPVVVPAGVGNGGIALQCGTWSSSNYMAAWIDFNKDGDMLDGAGAEKIHQSGPMNANTWTYASVSVPNVVTAPTPNVAGPLGIQYGNVKMRVREVFATTNIDVCASGYTFGEIEDYTLTIIPSCPVGVKLWLGYTNDWNTPSNWCGGVPTITDIALIDEVGYLGGSQTGAPYDPVINPGTVAVAKTIRIAATDTLTVNAPSGSSLQIADSLAISYNTPAGGTGRMRVVSAFADSAQLANGNVANTLTPWMSTRRQQRSQFIYTKNDLLTRGMIAGDVVDQLQFWFRAAAAIAANPYGNVSIKYATVDSTWAGWPAVPIAWAPATSPWVTIYSNAAFTLPAMGITGATAVQIPLIAGSFVWNGVSDIVVEICYDRGVLASGLADNLLCQTQVTGKNYYCRANGTSASPSGCAITFPVSLPYVALATQFRPNMTFLWHRPYAKFPINITGNGAVTTGTWVNNGAAVIGFTAGRSNVTFSNASANQTIGGSTPTYFSDITVNKTGAIANQRTQLLLNSYVDSSLALTSGYLDLNQRTLNITNPIPAAVTRTSGWILSETVPPTYGIVNWTIGTNAALHTFPFGTGTIAGAGSYIPVDFTNTNAVDKGIVSIATYRTAANNNTPYPTAGGPFAIPVQHMNGQSTGTDISITDVIDRFWQINKSGPTASDNAIIKFSYTPGVPATGEEPVGPSGYIAQRFQTPGGTGAPGGGWANRPGASVSGSVTATLVGDPISGPWTLSNLSNPLPVELLNFDAQLVKDKVKIWWSTASELDNDYFTVERTVNGNDYDFIASQKSKGNSSATQNYETYDNNPVVGLQYYRLKTTDLEGKHEYSKLVPVKYSKGGVFAINAVNANYSSNSLEVIFSYDSNEPFTYSVVDILGRSLVSKTGNAGFPGLNTLTIPVSLNNGIYFVVIQNKAKKAASKVVY